MHPCMQGRRNSRLRPALRPRPSLHASPLRRFSSAPGLSNAGDLSQVDSFGAPSHGSAYAVYASCRPHDRLRKTRFRLAATLCRSRSASGWVPSEWFPSSLTVDNFLLPWASLGAIEMSPLYHEDLGSARTPTHHVVGRAFIFDPKRPRHERILYLGQATDATLISIITD